MLEQQQQVSVKKIASHTVIELRASPHWSNRCSLPPTGIVSRVAVISELSLLRIQLLSFLHQSNRIFFLILNMLLVPKRRIFYFRQEMYIPEISSTLTISVLKRTFDAVFDHS